MKSYYWAGNNNFGDALNGWLWEKIFPELMSIDDDYTLIGVGSIINDGLKNIPGKKIIFGSGVGYGVSLGEDTKKQLEYYCVRGPLTAEKLGLDRKYSIIDSAWLIGFLPEYSETTTKKGIGFVPHWESVNRTTWDIACEKAGINYINPLLDSKSVIKQISESGLIIAESLHGAILADFFRIPWIPIQLSNNVLNFKWLDWCKSIDLEYFHYCLPPSDIVDHIHQKKVPKNDNTHYKKIYVDNQKVPPAHSVSALSNMKYVKSIIKTPARYLFNNTRDALVDHRDNILFSSWNEKRTDELASMLNLLSKEEPLLSRDNVREDRLGSLNDVVHRLKTNYPNL